MNRADFPFNAKERESGKVLLILLLLILGIISLLIITGGNVNLTSSAVLRDQICRACDEQSSIQNALVSYLIDNNMSPVKAEQLCNPNGILYIQSIPLDPFSGQPPTPYRYASMNTDYIIVSNGPDLDVDILGSSFLSLVYGFALAIPLIVLRSRLQQRTSDELWQKRMIIVGCLAILADENPSILERKLVSFLPPNQRPSWSDDDETLEYKETGNNKVRDLRTKIENHPGSLQSRYCLGLCANSLWFGMVEN